MAPRAWCSWRNPPPRRGNCGRRCSLWGGQRPRPPHDPVTDAPPYLAGKPEPFDVVFLDPPFAGGLLARGRRAPGGGGWLAPGALIYAECPAREALPPLPERLERRQNRAGRRGRVSSAAENTPNDESPCAVSGHLRSHHQWPRRPGAGAPASLFDRVVVAIASNAGKAPLFTQEKRVELARQVLADLPNVEVMGYSELTVEFARRHKLARDHPRPARRVGLRVRVPAGEHEPASMPRHRDRCS